MKQSIGSIAAGNDSGARRAGLARHDKRALEHQHAHLARHAIATAIAAAFGTVAACVAMPAWAQLPTGGAVAHGSAAIATDGNRMTVTNSPNAVLNWQSFSVGARNSVHFAQQSAASQVLNRVVGNDPSAILGSLSSNGGVWLVNPHGVLFGSNARIDVGGLVASTLALSNEDFLAGRFRFDSGALPGGQVLNQGEIRTSFGGRVWLMGDSVRNEGLVHSPAGHIVLAAGKSIELVDSGMPNVTVRVTAPDNEAVNLGTLLASGRGSIDVHGGIVNQQGIVRADSIGTDDGGRVVMKASGDVTLGAASRTSASAAGTGTGGQVLVQSATGATLVQGNVSATSGGGKGGRVHLLGEQVGVHGQAQVDASGATGADEVLVGGDYGGANAAVQNAAATYFGPGASIRANATGTGDGGKVILWGDRATRAFGAIAARGGPAGGNGGFVETSGLFLDAQPMAIDVGTHHGAPGTWLLDPGNISITEGCCISGIAGTINFTYTSNTNDAAIPASVIATAIESGNNVIVRTGGGANTSQEGDITVASDIVVQSDSATGSLTLEAHNDIIVNPGVKITALGTPMQVRLTADSDANNAGAIVLNSGVEIGTRGGAIEMFAANGSTGVGDGISIAGSTLEAGSGQIALNGNTVNISGNSSLTGVSFAIVSNATTVTGSTLTASIAGISLSARNPATSTVTLTSSTLTAESPNPTLGVIDIRAGTLDTVDATLNASGNMNLATALRTSIDGGNMRGSAIVINARAVDITGDSNLTGTNVGITAGDVAVTDSTLFAADGRVGVTASASRGTGGVVLRDARLEANADNNEGAGLVSVVARTLEATDTELRAANTIDVVTSSPDGEGASVVLRATSLFAGPESQVAGQLTITADEIDVGNTVLDGARFVDLVAPSVTIAADSTVRGQRVAISAQRLGIADSRITAWDGAIELRATSEAGNGAATLSNVVLDAAADSPTGADGIDIVADTSVMSGIDMTAAGDVSITGTATSIDNSGSEAAIRAAGLDITSGSTELDNVNVTASREGDAITIRTGTLVNRGSRFTTLAGRWLVRLGAGQQGFPAADLGELDYTFVQVNASEADPVVNGIGAHGILMDDPLNIEVRVDASRPYDRGTAATFSQALSHDGGTGILVLRREGSSIANGEFEDWNAGTNKPIIYQTEGGYFDISTANESPVYSATQSYVADITPKQVTLSGLAVVPKVYDATPSATLTGALAGIIEGDSVTVSDATGLFNDKNAGVDKPVVLTGGTLAGPDNANYQLTGGAATTVGTITPLPITAAGITAADKVYDGGVSATLAGSLSGALPGDDLSLAGATGAFDDKNAATNKPVTVTGGALAGADRANYLLEPGYVTRATIAQRPITTAGITAADKVYDGTRAAALDGTLSGMLPGDIVALEGATGLFADKNAQAAKPVTITGGELAGADAGNYVLAPGHVPQATIAPRPIGASGITAADKVYDGTRTASIAGVLAEALEGDDVSLTGATGLFDTKNAGNNKTVSITGGTLAGLDAGNYTLGSGTGASTTASIARRPISATGITAADKVYDGNRIAALSGSLSEAVDGDDVSLDGATGLFDDRNAGVDKPVAISAGALAGRDAGNYVLDGGHTATATIAPKPIAATGITALDKVYDGTRTASISGLLEEAIEGDDVALAGATGLFDTKNAGAGKVVTVTGGVLAGADAANYTLSGSQTTTAAITPRPLDATGIRAADKIYDGNRNATLSGTLSGAIAGDAVALDGATGQFDSKNVGTDKAVNITGGSLAGADAANYVLAGGGTARATIAPRPVDIGLAGQVIKEYDATTAASLGAGQFVLNGAIAGDAVVVGGPAQGSFDSANAGQGKTVSVTGVFQISGADAFNYRVGASSPANGAGVVTATVTGNVGTITPATLFYTATPAVREPGVPAAGLTGTVTGFKGDDSLASATTGVLVWQAASTQARPGLYPVLGSGLAALNYVLVQAPGNAVALEVTAGVSPANPPQRAQESSTAAIAAALASALPRIDAPRAGSGLLDMSNPAVGRTYGAVRIGAMSQDELTRMIAQRRDFKRKLFADAIYKLELDASLADVQPCTTVIEASSGACRITPNQLNLIQADTRLAALVAPVSTTGTSVGGSTGSSANGMAGKAAARAATAHVPQIQRKIAVLFGINDYADKTIPPLENAVPDVDAVSALLEQKLGYDVRVVRNPTKADIIRTLNQLSVEINDTDSVVIYYAGHGFSLEKSGAGYWLPADAQASEPGRWISNGDVARLLSGIRSSQMVLISDSCYSGAFARDGMDAVGRDVTPEGVLAKRSVVVISSGGDEPVADEGKAGHSIFAWNLMEAMRSVSAWKPGSTVFNDVQAGVRKEFPQTPKYGSVTAAGHQAGGDYLFELR
ncbi:YDG domain-containing protein [Pseudoduganella lutea]|nr:YDG domain-containing protein [Pseudoduganella lutea]